MSCSFERRNQPQKQEQARESEPGVDPGLHVAAGEAWGSEAGTLVRTRVRLDPWPLRTRCFSHWKRINH